VRNLHLRLRRAQARLGAHAVIVLAFGVASAHGNAHDVTTRPYLLGDWNGLRTRLADRGIEFDLSYGSQVAHNVSGGTGSVARYADQWAFGTTLDLNKLWDWRGAEFQATVTDRNGRNLGADAHIGNNMLVQEVYGRGQTWHLTQFWVNQKLLGDRLQIKLGRLTVGEDFASFSCEFQNLTFCGSQPGNLVSDYWINWPTSQWAARVKFQVSRERYVQLGVYQVNPHYVDDDYARQRGWKLDNPSGTTGALIPLEAGWLSSWKGLPGSYKLGVWYNSSDATDLYDDVNRQSRGMTGLATLKRSGQFGTYLNFQQQISGRAGAHGATLFLNMSQADRRTARVDGQFAMGIQYRGIFGRPADAVGLAVGATHNNSRYANFIRDNNLRTQQNVMAGSGYEYVGEVYYSWSRLPSVFLRPNLQYIRHPGGTDQNKNAIVLGIKSGLTF